MNREEAKQLLDKLFSKKIELDKQWDAFEDISGAASESPLGDAIWKLFDFAAIATAAAVGDDIGYVEWFIWDNDLGKKGYESIFAGGKKQKIKTVDDLLDVIGYPPRTPKRKPRVR